MEAAFTTAVASYKSSKRSHIFTRVFHGVVILTQLAKVATWERLVFEMTWLDG